MQHSSPPPLPGQKYPPLTPAQQRLVLRYRKIAGDYARRLAAPYRRFIDADEATSIADLTLCRAAQRYDATRAASGIWPLTKMMLPQQVSLALRVAMDRARGRRINLDALVEVIDKPAALRNLRGRRGPVNDLSDRLEALTASDDDRDALRAIAEWVSENPTRAETIDRVVAGEAPLTPEDVGRLAALRGVLGLPVADVVDVATASLMLGRSPKALRGALTRGTVPGYRCGSTWRVFLKAALRCADAERDQ